MGEDSIKFDIDDVKRYKKFESGLSTSLDYWPSAESSPSSKVFPLDLDSRICDMDELIRQLSYRMENVEYFMASLEDSGAILRFPFTRHLVCGRYGSDGKFTYVVETVTYNSIEDVLGFDKGMCFSNPEDAALAANKLNLKK